jgi:serine protease Do
MRLTWPKIQRLWVTTCIVLLSGTASAAKADLQVAVDRVVNEVKPALVRIHVVSASYREGRELKFQSSGSGVIVTPEGHVVTNHHVAGHATRMFCTLSNREEIEAELVGTDPLSDIAVIKLLPEDGRRFPTARWGDSDTVAVGDHVLAMGSPRALSQSVTLGIASNTAMVMPRRMGMSGAFMLDGEDVGSMVRWIAHDAEIHPGNSGGPLLNLSGEIIGINEISMGLGGAIPGNLARSVAEEIMKTGTVNRSWIGLGLQPLLKHGELDKGVLITGALKESPAEAGGIQSGDILLAVNGESVQVRFDEDMPTLNLMLASLPIDRDSTLTILRDGSEQKIQIRPELRKPVLEKQREFREWGLTGRDISFIQARELKRDNAHGVQVTSVRPGGPAGDAKPSINPGDIIVEVAGEPVINTDDLDRITGELMKESTAQVPVLTTYERHSKNYVTAVSVGLRELSDPSLEVKKAWLPVEAQVITRDIARLLGTPDLTGFRVTQVYAESTAEAAGLQVGDLILAVDGERLTASAPEHYEELPTLIRNYRDGDTAELAILRDGERKTVPVELVRSPMLDREMRKYRDANFEFTARDITFFDKADKQWSQDQLGVLVEEVTSGGWAALAMLSPGDLILSVNDIPTPDVERLREVMEQIASERPKAVVMKVRQGIYTVFIELEPKWD